jgi:thioredoxin 1
MIGYLSDNPSPESINALPGKVVLEFGTDGCGHCQAAKSIVDQALATQPDVQHLRVEDGKGRRLGRVFGVKLWPTLIFLNNGQEVARVVRPTTVDAVQQAVQKFT